ncbi:metallophosphoesterase [Stenotrophomonas sp. CFBP 13718]|uniref:metallophosphoesterase family protein n=1 Tax=Stenotrophomonas sp. CFBP 13718 TaxID=2775304 RepID=UPI0017807CAB|nr:metallophosphoesterase [Stenotrophomonas sp. CFBP 13718]MBD8696736.1 metallophosphoesterase [Stenotrophomonas sp. CFBP 13718]
MEMTGRALHISDLHYGMGHQGTLMPAFKAVLFDDFRLMAEVHGPWDLVIFSGDLVQSGSANEYQALEYFLSEIWECFNRIGFQPKLFCVPGNHDLVRPSSGSPVAKAMAHWWDGADVSNELFDAPSEYRHLVDKSFSNYSAWLQNTRIPLVTCVNGVLPGDSMASVDINGIAIGLVGLNSSWLQIRGGDLKGALHVDTRQLLGVCGDPDAWSRQKDVTLVVTHHPVDWLHLNSQAEWRSEIDTNGRFDMHLFGHMHEPGLHSNQSGGGSNRRGLQAASLFGLEQVGDRRIDRRHGYSLISFSKRGDSVDASIFPRTARVILSGERRLVPDVDLGLDRNDAIRVDIRSRERGGNGAADGMLNKELIDKIDSNVLLAIRRTLPEKGAWGQVRKAERERSVASLRSGECLWMVAEWGVGFDTFLAVIAAELGVGGIYYGLECDVTSRRQTILQTIQDRAGTSLEEICLALSTLDACLLVIDDVREDISGDDAVDFSEVLTIISEYCPKVRLIVKSRVKSLIARCTEVTIKALDDFDSALYVRAWQQGKCAQIDEGTLARILRHADGDPRRLDSLLEDFEMFGVDELAALNPDLEMEVGTQAVGVSPIIASEILRLRASPDSKRLLELLQVLAMFPRGEAFESVKRFNGAMGFHPKYAKELRRLALLETAEVASLSGQTDKVLLVPVPVREAVYEEMSSDLFNRLSLKVVNLYFGEDWGAKGLKASKVRFDDGNCSA